VTSNELKVILKASTEPGQTSVTKTTGQQNTQEGDFKEVRRQNTEETDQNNKEV
jgi:hypothetical protein